MSQELKCIICKVLTKEPIRITNWVNLYQYDCSNKSGFISRSELIKLFMFYPNIINCVGE